MMLFVYVEDVLFFQLDDNDDDKNIKKENQRKNYWFVKNEIPNFYGVPFHPRNKSEIGGVGR
jgi:hypothetical protein